MSEILFTIQPLSPVDFTIVPTSVNITVGQSAPVSFSVNPTGERGLQGLQGVQGVAGDNQIYTAGENINSHMPIALVGGLAYKMDNLNPLHQFAFVGFSKTSATIGATITIETVKIELAGWGLLPNQNYLVGANGALITSNTIQNSFTKIVGFSQSATTMLIVKDYTSINKN